MHISEAPFETSVITNAGSWFGKECIVVAYTSFIPSIIKDNILTFQDIIFTW